MQCKLQNLTGQSGGAGSRQSGRRQRGCTEGESVADTSDWCSWNEEEKSNQKHDTCGAGEQDEREQQDGWAVEQKGGGEDTCDCGSESHSIPWSRAGAQEKCSHDESKAGWEREVEAEKQGGRVQGDDQHWTTRVSPYRCGSTG